MLIVYSLQRELHLISQSSNFLGVALLFQCLLTYIQSDHEENGWKVISPETKTFQRCEEQLQVNLNQANMSSRKKLLVNILYLQR